MTTHEKASPRSATTVPIVVSIVLICIVYGNTLFSSWHYDDLPNILENSKIHMTRLDLDSLTRAMFANPDGRDVLHRPVAFITFALNWYFHTDGVVGYHIVNIFIHLCSFLALYRLLSHLAVTPMVPPSIRDVAERASLYGALLWAINPIQIQAITYIVQRVASLAALFYLLGLLCYVMARLDRVRVNRAFFLYCLAALSFVLAVFSKESAFTFPLAIAAIELFFFRVGKIRLSKQVLASLVVGGLFLLLVGIFLYEWLGFANTYADKAFTLAERLMTEARVLLFYLSQIFYPVPQRLSLVHHVDISTGLFTPPTTIVSIIILLALSVSCVAFRRKLPILLFPFFFFLVAHLVESTVVPLELVYEHRNYLASAFIFWPIAFYVLSAVDKLRLIGSKVLAGALICCFTLYGASFAFWTWQRNQVWKSEEMLWLDVARKYPELARAHQYVAMQLQKRGEFDGALELYRRSLEKFDETPGRSAWLAHNNSGLIYLELGQFDQARTSFEKALDAMSEDGSIAYLNLIRVYISQGSYQQAEELIDRGLLLNPKHGKYLNLKGFVCLRLGRADEAAWYFHQAEGRIQDSRIPRYNRAMALVKAARYAEAARHLDELIRDYGSNLLLLLMKMENALRAGLTEEVDYLTTTILSDYTVDAIRKALFVGPDDLPLATDLVGTALEQALREQVYRLP